jgi:hypothetical protein
MSEFIEKSRTKSVRVKTEDGKLYVQTVFNDDANLALAKKLRDSELLNRARLKVHDNADIRAQIMCPTGEQWILFQRQFPEVYKNLHSTNEEDRMRAVTSISILHPEWVVYARH